MRYLAILAAALALAGNAHAEPPAFLPDVGDTFELALEQNSSSRGANDSSSSSFDRWTLVERVISRQDDGLVLEFDLPGEVGEADRQRQWQYPVRVLKPATGPLRLLNREDLEKRVDAWLAAAHLPRSACGRWIFSWTAYQIQCDPLAVVETVRQFDLDRNDLRDGALFEDAGALEPQPLRRVEDPSGAVSFTVALKVDPAVVRRSSAESEAAVAEMTGGSTTLEEAVRAHANDPVSGTISLTFDVDSVGAVWRRTRITVIEVTTAEGEAETTTTTETLIRRRKG